MAIKLTLAAALLAALVASAFATTFTTTVEEDTNPSRPRCSEQMQDVRFDECRRYMMQGGSMQECCQVLMEMDGQGCGCEAVRHAMRQAQMGPGGQQTGMAQRVYERARELPQMCNLREQQCSFSLVFL